MAYAWIVWLVLAAIFIGIEAMTPGFFLLWFGVGSLAAALLALAGIGGIGAQIIVFLVVSVVLLITSRSVIDRFFQRNTSETHLKTGVETLVGQVATVVEASSGALNEAAVRVYGSVWTAFPNEGESPLQVGESVAVDRIDGNILYVRRRTTRQHLFSETSENA